MSLWETLCRDGVRCKLSLHLWGGPRLGDDRLSDLDGCIGVNDLC